MLSLAKPEQAEGGLAFRWPATQRFTEKELRKKGKPGRKNIRNMQNQQKKNDSVKRRKSQALEIRRKSVIARKAGKEANNNKKKRRS